MTSHDQFTPHYSHSMEVIGGTKRRNLLSDRSRLSGGISTPGTTGLRIAETLDTTIQEHYPTVGGYVQAAFVTKDKYFTLESWDIGSANDMRRTTLRPDETH